MKTKKITSNMYKQILLKAMSFLILLMYTNHAFSISDEGGWYLTGYTFKDGSMQKESVLAGTTSRMKDVIMYKGDKGNIEIMQNRYGVPHGKQLAGVTYQVKWTNPPSTLKPGDKCSFEFQLTTKASKTWKAPQQSMHINQGMSGVYFVTPDGTKYITKDISATLTTEKSIEKGTKGAKRNIQMNFGNGFSATYSYEWRDGSSSQTNNTFENSGYGAWQLTNYTFKDGSMQKKSVLAGTTSRMKDVIMYKGDKGNIEIMQNRYGVPDGKQLAGVTYQVKWTNPPSTLKPGDKCSFEFQLTTKASKAWKAPQQSMHINQGMSDVYFVTPDGTKYITKDINATLTTEKSIEKGTKGAKRNIQMNFGNGFSATYSYEWRE